MICYAPYITCNSHQAFAEIGYVLGSQVLDSSKHSSRTRRRRAWIVAFEIEACGLTPWAAVATIERIFTLVASFESGPAEDVESLIMRSTDPYVLRHLQQSQQAQLSGVDPTMYNQAGKKAEDVDWPTRAHALLTKDGLRWSQVVKLPDPAQRASPWFETLHEREKVTLGYNMFLNPDATSFDVYQRIDRVPVGRDNIFSTFLPGSRVWSMTSKRLLTGKDKFVLHGMPKAVLDVATEKAHVTDSRLSSLVGNSFDAHVLVPLMIALFIEFPVHAFKQRLLDCSRPPSCTQSTVSSIDEMFGLGFDACEDPNRTIVELVVPKESEPTEESDTTEAMAVSSDAYYEADLHLAALAALAP